MRSASLVLVLLFAQQLSVSDGLALSVNPIRRVVTMLQMMQKKVEAEGKAEEKLFDKYMCWCQTGAGDLKKAIEEAETKIPQLESSIKALEEEVGQLVADLEKAKKDRAEAKEVVANGKALRAKEAAAFAKESGEMKSNLEAMTKAIKALETGMAGAFLQTSGGAVLRQLTVNMDLSPSDRDVLASFLSQGQGQGYAPQSGEIVGILKQMADTMAADLKEITEAEAKAKAAQIEALTQEIEEKTERLGNNGVELVNMKEDLEDTKKSLEEDKAFLADLEKNCKTKEAEWAVRQKTRAEEILAILDTIKILNDDDALELFKKTLPSPSLLQVKASGQEVKHLALKALAGSKHDVRVDLIAMSLRGRKVSFEKIIKMIDDMVVLLGKEQKTDDDKKAYCEAELDKAEDEAKELEHAIDDLAKAIEETKGSIETLTQEIADLTQGIKDLDKAVADATEQRKEEHAEYTETLAANNAAKDVIAFAKNRLQKFYNPKLYVAPAKREVTEEQRVTLNMGGTLAPTAPPAGIAGTGISALQDAPPPPPETYGAYQKKGQESAGVMSMMDMLVADLDKEITEMEVEEKDAQSEYEQFMEDSAAKRAADAQSISEKEAAKAGLAADLEKMTAEKKVKMTEAMAKHEYIGNLHKECDWLVSNFEVRKEARAGEVDSLKKAKAVLSGADYSM